MICALTKEEMEQVEGLSTEGTTRAQERMQVESAPELLIPGYSAGSYAAELGHSGISWPKK